MWPLSEEAVCRLKKGKEKQSLTFLDIPGVYFPVTACGLLCPFSAIVSCYVFLSPTHSRFASPTHPRPPLVLLAAGFGLPPSLSLSLCHVCNLNCGTAKQGWATRKAFHKISLSLWSLPGPCSVRNEMGAAHFHFPLCTASFQPVLSISAAASDFSIPLQFLLPFYLLFSYVFFPPSICVPACCGSF